MRPFWIFLIKMSRTFVTGSIIKRATTWKYSAVIRGLKLFSWASFTIWLPQTERIRERSAAVTTIACLLSSSGWSLELSFMSLVNNLKLVVMFVHSDLRPRHHRVMSLIPSIWMNFILGLEVKNNPFLIFLQFNLFNSGPWLILNCIFRIRFFGHWFFIIHVLYFG